MIEQEQDQEFQEEKVHAIASPIPKLNEGLFRHESVVFHLQGIQRLSGTEATNNSSFFHSHSFPLPVQTLPKLARNKKYAILALSDALTDCILTVKEEQLQELEIIKNASIPINEETKGKIRKLMKKTKFSIYPGGSPTNTVFGASNLGLRCAFMGCVGNDDYGYDFISSLRQNDVDPFISVRQGTSAICYALITPDGDRSFGLDFGITKQFSKDDIFIPLIEESHFLHFSAYELRDGTPLAEATMYAVQIAKQKGTLLSLDMGDSFLIENYFKDIMKLLNEHMYIIFANEDEANTFCTQHELMMQQERRLSQSEQEEEYEQDDNNKLNIDQSDKKGDNQQRENDVVDDNEQEQTKGNDIILQNIHCPIAQNEQNGVIVSLYQNSQSQQQILQNQSILIQGQQQMQQQQQTQYPNNINIFNPIVQNQPLQQADSNNNIPIIQIVPPNRTITPSSYFGLGQLSTNAQTSSSQSQQQQQSQSSQQSTHTPTPSSPSNIGLESIKSHSPSKDSQITQSIPSISSSAIPYSQQCSSPSMSTSSGIITPLVPSSVFYKYRVFLSYCDIIVIKLGDKGSVALTLDKVYFSPAYKVEKVLDTNGAGDNFQSGFFYGLFRGLSVQMSLKIGNFIASRVIGRRGAQSQVRISGIEYLI